MAVLIEPGVRFTVGPMVLTCKGPLFSEHFEYPEIGIVDSRLLKARIQILRGRPKGLPQYEQQ
jgi:hypothetical protein